MKKLLLSLVATIFAIGANAQEITIDFNNIAALGLNASDFTTDDTGTYYEVTTKTNLEGVVTDGVVVIKDIANAANATTSKIWYYTNTKTGISNYQYRTYKNHTVKISLKDGSKIVQIKGNGDKGLDYTGDATSEVVLNITATTKLNSLTITTEGGSVTPPVGPKTVTVSQAIDIINALADNATTSETYIVTGTITDIAQNFGTTYGTAEFTVEGGLVGFRLHYLNKQKETSEAKLTIGDAVTMEGKLQKYVKDGVVKPELIDGYISNHIQKGTPITPTIKELTIAEAIAATNALANAGTSTEQYILEGTITNLQEINTQYGNATFTISDGTGEFLVYRAKDLDNVKFTDENKIKVGDKVKVQGQLKKYVKDDVITPELINGYLLSIDSAVAINNATANTNNATAHNLAGQKVSSTFKGIVIKNGKKTIMK